MSGNVQPYLDLITSEHAAQPDFVATVSATVQPWADLLAQLQAVPGLFDLDSAVGAQLDIVGQWVGQSRYIALPLTNVYFAFDENGVGFDQGIWFEALDPTTSQYALPDDHYRLLLRAKIASNQWDGSIPAAYAAYDILFSDVVTILPQPVLDNNGNEVITSNGQVLYDDGSSINYGMSVLIQDNGDMTMLIGLVGTLPDPLTVALLTGGYLTLKPVGVRIAGYIAATVPEAALFGFDVENSAIAGFDVGSWGAPL